MTTNFLRAALYRRMAMIACAAIVGCAGCAGLQMPSLPRKVAGERVIRKEDAVKQFEAARDRAQLEAARMAWKSNDVSRCESELAQLLKRSPHFREARQFQAEVFLTTDRVAQAREQLDALLNENEADALAHDTLGLALEALGRNQDALLHFRRAVELEPRNEIYQAHCDEWEAILGTAAKTARK